MKKILKELSENQNVTFYPKKGLPKIKDNHELPKDLRDLYENCGSIGIFEGELCMTYIYPPDKFVLANDVNYTQEFLKELRDWDENHHQWRSNWWYSVASIGDGNEIIVDLHEERYGNYYLCKFGNYDYDEEGDMPIIAKSVKELIERTLTMNGSKFYWEEKDFKVYGNAFD